MRTRSDPIVVLMSTPPLTPRTNPYATLLTNSLAKRADVSPEFFDWRLALVGRYDVLHLHWPESHLRGGNLAKTLARQALFTAVVVRARVLRRPIVRTVHNVELPTGLSRREELILRLIERWTVLRIRMNADTPVPQL